MNIKSKEKKENSIVEILVEVSAEEFDTAVNEAFRKSRNSISVPGFRKGKAPRKIVERMYGASVFHEDALDIIMPKVLSLLDEQLDLKLVGMPHVTDVDIKEDNSGVDVTVSAAVYPEVTLGAYKGLSAVKPAAEVMESEIDGEIDGIRRRNARIEKADRPAVNGDIAVIDYEGFVDGETFEGGSSENYELKLGSGAFIPGFEEKVEGMAAGEERSIELMFPENYAEPLAGKPVVFKVKLIEVRENILPDLDDEFAKDVSEFDTLDEYKADIRERRLKIKREEADAAFENALIEKVVESLEADMPDAMVEEQMDNAMQNFTRQVTAYGMEPAAYLQMMNTTPEEFRENSRASSEKQAKMMLALEKIAELEDIKVSDEEIENDYKEASERYGMELDRVKETVPADTIASDIKLRRAAKIVVENAFAEDPPADTPEEIPDNGNRDPDTEGETAPADTAKKPKKTADKKTSAEAETEANAVAGTDAGQQEKPKKAPAKKTAPVKEPEPETSAGPPDGEPEKPKKPASPRKTTKPKVSDTEGVES